MTEDIQKAVAKMQVLKFHSPVIENFQPFWKYEYDVFSISKSGMFCEFEVKISRSDFLKQKEKTKMMAYATPLTNGQAFWHSRVLQVPNYFSYCCPTDLIKLQEIPPYAGLYYFNGAEIIEVKKPSRIHPYEFKQERIKDKILRYYSERNYLGGCRMTYNNNKITEKYSQTNLTP